MLPRIGDTDSGYRFLGGDPSDESSWQPLAGYVPQPGDVVDGYQFGGGNPGDQNAWTPFDFSAPVEKPEAQTPDTFGLPTDVGAPGTVSDAMPAQPETTLASRIGRGLLSGAETAPEMFVGQYGGFEQYQGEVGMRPLGELLTQAAGNAEQPGAVDSDAPEWLQEIGDVLGNAYERAMNMGTGLLSAAKLPALAAMNLGAGADEMGAALDDATAQGAQRQEAANQELAKAREALGDDFGAQLGFDVSSNLVNMMPALAVGFGTGNPVLASSLMGAQVGSETYGRYRAEGKSPDAATSAAKAFALAETLTEAVPIAAILGKGGSAGLRRLIDSTLGEGAQEALTEIIQSSYDATQLEGLTLQQALRDIDWNQVAYAGGLGALIGGGIAATTEPFIRRQQERAEIDQAMQPVADLGDADAQARAGMDPGTSGSEEAWNQGFQPGQRVMVEGLTEPAEYLGPHATNPNLAIVRDAKGRERAAGTSLLGPVDEQLQRVRQTKAQSAEAVRQAAFDQAQAGGDATPNTFDQFDAEQEQRRQADEQAATEDQALAAGKTSLAYEAGRLRGKMPGLLSRYRQMEEAQEAAEQAAVEAQYADQPGQRPANPAMADALRGALVSRETPAEDTQADLPRTDATQLDARPGLLSAEAPPVSETSEPEIPVSETEQQTPTTPAESAAPEKVQSDVPFTATHETSDGTPVAATGEANVFRTEDGDEIIDPYAEPIQDGPLAIKTPIDQAAHESAESPLNDRKTPSSAQIEANNWKQGHGRMLGRKVKIESPAGSERSDKETRGDRWRVTMPAHYGDFEGTKAPDGDPVDVTIKPGTPEDHAGPVFVIDQIDPETGKFDEPKVFAGYESEQAATADYYLSFSDNKGPDRMGAITQMTPDEANAYLDDEARTTRPVAYREPQAIPPGAAPPAAGVEPTNAAEIRKLASHYTGGTFRLRDLAGPANKSARKSIIQALIGRTPASGAVGINRLLELAYTNFGIQGGTMAARDRALEAALRGDGSPNTETPTTAVPVKEIAAVKSTPETREATRLERIALDQGQRGMADAMRQLSEGKDPTSGLVSVADQLAAARRSLGEEVDTKEPAPDTTDEDARRDLYDDEIGARINVMKLGLFRARRAGNKAHEKQYEKEISKLRRQIGQPVPDDWSMNQSIIDADPGVQAEIERVNGISVVESEIDDLLERQKAATGFYKTQVEQQLQEARQRLSALEGGDATPAPQVNAIADPDTAIAAEPAPETGSEIEAEQAADTGFGFESTPEAKASLQSLLDDPGSTRISGYLVDGTDQNGVSRPDWSPVPGKPGFSARQYVWDGKAHQEIKAPNGSIVSRGMEPGKKPFASFEWSGTIDDGLSGAAFEEFDSFFSDQQKAIPAPAPAADTGASAESLAMFDDLLAEMEQETKPKPAPRKAPAAKPVDSPLPVSTHGMTEIAPQPREGDATLRAGALYRTESGRLTQPMPKLDFSTPRKANASELRLKQWLAEEAIAEAEARGDDFNGRMFSRLDPRNWSQADGDSVNEYVFGDPDGLIADRAVDAPKQPRQRTAGQTAKSAASHAGKGVSKSIQALGELFGGKGKLSMGPTFDEETYAKALPIFKEAASEFRQAGQDLVQVMRTVMEKVRDAYGMDTMRAMRVYIARFVDDVAAGRVDYNLDQEGTNDVDSSLRGEGEEALGEVASGQDGETQKGGPVRDRNPGRGRSRAKSGNRTGTRRGAGSRGRGTGTAASDNAAAGTGDRIDPAGNIPATNYRITDETELGKGGEATKFRDNLAAIETLKRIEVEQRRATPEEQRILARYVGWGGLASAFPDPTTGEFKKEWAERGQQLQDILTEAEYKAARRSTRNAHYTSRTVVDAMWSAVEKMGVRNVVALESSAGTGNFLGLTPEAINTKFLAVEYDSTTARIAKALYPGHSVIHSGFQELALPGMSFDLAIGNPPFGKESLRFQFSPELNGLSIHNQFLLANMDALRRGGIQAVVVSRYFMDAQDATTRQMLQAQGDLVAAIRLPDTAFQENARTEVVTDILFFQKLDYDPNAEVLDREGKPAPKLPRAPAPWLETVEIPDPLGGEPMRVNRYFAENPHMVMGTLERSGSMARGADITVRMDKGDDLGARLAEVIERHIPSGLVASRSDEAHAAALDRFEKMVEALEIARQGLEIGSMTISDTGQVLQVIERETPEGEWEMTRRELTEDAVWAQDFLLGADGKWYAEEDAVDPATGEKLKVMKGGKATKRNVKVRRIYDNEADIPSSKKLGATGLRRVKALVEIRDMVVEQINLEITDAPERRIEKNRKKLRAAYDAFVAREGLLSEPKNVALIREMPDEAMVLMLERNFRPAVTEKKSKKTGDAERPAQADLADILTKRTQYPYTPPESAESASDALSISLSEVGRVDLDRIGKLLGKDRDAVIADLYEKPDKPLIFRDVETGEWVTANHYLSGQVARKLRAAEQAGLDKHVAALEAVQPEPWTADQITPIMGSAWIPTTVYADFIQHLTGEPGHVSYSRLTNAFHTVVQDSAKSKRWSTESARASWLIGRILNSQSIKIYTPRDRDGKRYLMESETAEAQMKAKEIGIEFEDWIYRDSERRAQVVKVFNDLFNTRVHRQHDGSHLTLPGKVPDEITKMRRHQNNAIWRGISERFMLIDHAVGAGKTFTAIARALERRRMGLSRKPMIVVPNHMVEQFAIDAKVLYPGANVLAAGSKDFGQRQRRRLFAKIATGDWDLVIVPHSSFKMISISPEAEMRYLEAEIDLAKQAIKDAEEQAAEDGNDTGRFKPFTVKTAEALAEKLENRMKKLKSATRDRLLTFEQLGVDDLTIDEAHEFKNLFYSSRLSDARGMGNPAGSQKAYDLYQKVRVLRDSPTGSVVFMTGTPISNSAVEMYTIMRYLAMDELSDLGMEGFDAWRSQFVEATEKYEPNEAGQLKPVTRLGRNWSNMRSLMDLYYSFTDAVTNDDIKAFYPLDNDGKPFPIPKVKGGERQRVIIQPTPLQAQFLEQVLAGFDGLKGISNPKERNAQRLRLMDQARKVSVDIRVVDPRAQEDPGAGKLGEVANNIKRIYDQWTADRGTQLVFLDRSVPSSRGDKEVIGRYDSWVKKRDDALASDNEAAYRKAIDALEAFDANEIEAMRRAQAGGWNAYQQIKDNLIAMGIPAKEIAFVQEANTDKQKQELFDRVNDGEVRVLIGSTPRMGAGTNVQKRLVGLHHVDVTWKPSDIEQREGRIIRQKNSLLDKYGIDNFEVEILAYATERTVDAKMWDLNATKLKMINGIRNYNGEFNMEFEDKDSVGMAELAALASGNPLLLQRVELSSDIDRLEMAKRGWQRSRYGLQDDIATAQRRIETLPKRIQDSRKAAADIKQRLREEQASGDGKTVTVEGETYTVNFEAAKAASAAILAQRDGDPKSKKRFSIEVGGERVTTQEAVQEAIDNALGDVDPFAFTMPDGTVTNRRKVAAEAIAEKVAATGSGIKKGSATKTIRIGGRYGLQLEIDIAPFGKSSVTVEPALVEDDGTAVITSKPLVFESTEHKEWFTAMNARGLLRSLTERAEYMASGQDADYMQSQLDQATKDLPDLEAEIERQKEFPKEAELVEKRAKLQEVVDELTKTGATVVNDDDAAGGDVQFDSAVPNTTGGRRVSRVRLNRIVAEVRRKWPGAPAIHVARGVQDLPPHIQASAERQGVIPRAAVDMETLEVYLVAGKFNSEKQVRLTLAHELVGHAAAEEVLAGMPGGLQGALDEINRLIDQKRLGTIPAEVARRWGTKLAPNNRAREVLAVIAERRARELAPAARDLLARMMTAVRAWLRKVGLGSEGWTRAELRDIIRRAERRLGDDRPLTVNGQGAQFAPVWHGSPHKFDRFDLQHIGSGEGAQSFGWGLYLADSRGVAQSYAEELGYDLEIDQDARDAMKSLPRVGTIQADAGSVLYGSAYSMTLEGPSFVADSFRRRGDEAAKGRFPEDSKTYYALADMIDAGKIRPTGGNLYQVDLPDSAIDAMLDWDAPLSEQPEPVAKRLRAAGVDIGEKKDGGDFGGFRVEFAPRTGAHLYHDLYKSPAMDAWVESERKKGNFDPVEAGNSDKRSSLFLASIGIPGIKYFDGTSRKAGEGTRNYVVFDDSLLTIIDRNGEPVTMQEAMDEQQATNQTDTPAFKRWFGDSKVVDANGEPLVVYHATDENFETFDFSRLGRYTERNATDSAAVKMAEVGVWANNQALSGVTYQGIDMPLFMAISNPLEITFNDLWEMASESESGSVLRAQLEREGYDGIALRDDEFGGQSFVAFRPNQIKSAIGNNGNFDPADERIQFDAEDGGRAFVDLPRSASKLDLLRFRIQDKFIALRRVEERAVDPARSDWSPYRAEELYHGKVTKRLDRFHEATLEPLTDLIAQTGMELADIGRWLHARHAAEANKRLEEINPDRENNEALSGMDDATAEEILAEHAHNPILQRIGRMIDNMNDTRLSILEDEGLESPDIVDAMRQAYLHYVPLMRIDAETYEGSTKAGGARGRGFSSPGGRDSKIRGGSNLPVDYDNMLAHMVAKYETTLIRAEKARVNRALLLFLANNPSPGRWEIDRKKQQATLKMNPLTGLAEIQYVVDPREYDNQIKVRFGDEIHTITFDMGNDYARMIATAMKNLDANQQNGLVSGLLMVNRYLSWANTSANPEFMIANPVRDVVTAIYNLQSTEASDVVMPMLKSVFPAWNGIRDAINARREGASTGASGEWAKWFRDFEEDGARTGWVESYSTINDRTAAVSTMIKMQKGTGVYSVLKPTQAALDWISDQNAALENAVRLSAYVHARKKFTKQNRDAGMDRADAERKARSDAASLAKNLTVNFNRKGDWGPTLNAFYLFYNAGMQGSVRMLQTARHSRRGQAMMAGTVAFAAFLEVMNALIGGEDDDGNLLYYNAVEDHTKERNLVIMTGPGDSYIKPPLPWGYNVLHVFGQEIGKGMLSMMDPRVETNALDGTLRVVNAMLQAFNPIQGATVGQTLAPTLMQPVVQYEGNKDWTGRNLYPEPLGVGPKKPMSELFYGSEDRWTVSLARTLNELTGGNPAKPGLVDVSPELFDLLIDTGLGGAGRFATDVTDLPAKLWSMDFETRDFPMVRKLIGSKSSNADRRLFYENADLVESAAAQFKLFKENRDKEGMASVRERYGSLYRKDGFTNRQRERLSDLRRRADAIRTRKDLDDATKDQMLRRIDEKKDRIYLNYNRQINRIRIAARVGEEGEGRSTEAPKISSSPVRPRAFGQ